MADKQLINAWEDIDSMASKVNGYDLQVSESLPDLTFNTTTRTLSVSVKSGSSNFYFWSNGKKITKTTTQTVIIPDTTSTYYVYFDNTGALVAAEESAVTNQGFMEYSITALIYWNKTAQSALVGNELHGIRMSASTHQYNHMTYGARYESGFDLSGMVDNTTSYTGTSLGKFWDEDIQHSIAAQTTHPFIYKLGATGEWTGTTPDNLVGFENGTTNVVYNENDGGTWKLTESGSATDYIIYFFIATPDIIGYSVKKIIGQNGYKDRNAARDAIGTELANITTDGLPSPEFIFLYAYIVRQNGDLEEMDDNDGLFLDLRNSKGGYGSTSPAETKTFTDGINITVSEYADNAAALTGGLIIGDVYRTVDIMKIVH